MIKKLKEYPFLNEEIKKLKEELDFFTKELKYNTKITPTYSHCKGVGNSITDKVLNQVIEIEEKFDKKIKTICLELNKCIEEKEEIDKFLKSLNLLEKRVIENKYFYKKSWEEIGRLINCSSRTAKRIHKNVMDNINN